MHYGGLVSSADAVGSLWHRLRFVLLTLLIMILMLEALLRLFAYQPIWRPNQHRIPDATLGWRLEPNAVYRYPTSDGVVQVTYNERGWRDELHSFEKPADVYRIVLLGDSFMEAYSVDGADALYSQLEAQAAGTPVEVINLGVGGYGTLQAYLALVEEGLAYQPDLVLLSFYAGNDLTDNDPELNSRVRSHELQIDARPYLASTEPLTVTDVDYAAAVDAYEQALRRVWFQNSALWHIVELVFLTEGTRPEQRQALYAPYFCEPTAEIDRAWQTTDTLLLEMSKVAKQADADFAVFYTPAMPEVVPEARVRVLERVPAPDELCFDDPPVQKRLEELLDEHNIAYVDLLPTLRKAQLDGVTVYLSSDFHWTVAAHRLAAQTVHAELGPYW